MGKSGRIGGKTEVLDNFVSIKDVSRADRQMKAKKLNMP
jgi:hypothetical protein